VCYFFLNERHINETKVLNMLSFFFKNSKIILNENDRTEENKEKIRLITTGIKYTKEKTNSDIIKDKKISHKNKSKKFDLLQYLSRRITIKYVNKGPRKRPVEHHRKGHYRHYKNGRVVWIQDSIINAQSNNTNSNNRSAS